MRRAIIVIVALVLSSPALPAAKKYTITEFLRDYQAGGAAERNYLNGLSDGISMTNVGAKYHGHPLYCPPGELALVNDQTVDIIRRTLVKRPDLGTISPEGALLIALEETFPCK